MKHVLTIAGSDPSGGAGIQADLKTMCAHGVYGMSVIAAVTVQNTKKVYDVQDIAPHIVAGQMDAIYTDIPVHAVKIGMVSNTGLIDTIKTKLLEHNAKNIVVDPVMVSKSGYRLLKEEAEQSIQQLCMIADIITPNIPEAEILAGMKIDSNQDMYDAAERIIALGANNVLIKGGHRSGDADDLLYTAKGDILWFPSPRIDTKHTHGTGCTLSSAITCNLAAGMLMPHAVSAAKAYITTAIKNGLNVGHGVGPVGHLVQLYKDAGMQVELS